MSVDMPSGVFLRSGKVRDLYALGSERLVLVASDRISAFDVVLPTTVPDKGRVLTGVSRFWFQETAHLVGNHLVGTDPTALPPDIGTPAEMRGRILICRRTEPLPVELIVRGYLSGSGWLDYQATGSVSGVRLSRGLRESDRLPEPVFTPSTKADTGHDRNIDFDAMVEIVGGPVAERARDIAIALYRYGAERAERAGILLADTKFELGIEPLAWPDPWADDPSSRAPRLVLIDEAMTPDSSRLWEASAYEPGHAQPSYDKQFVRDWLLGTGWDRTPPGPELPGEVVAGTRARYIEAFERLTGGSFERYLRDDTFAPEPGTAPLGALATGAGT